ncbi:MAG: AMP-binding protein [Thiolinea sp.]
MNTAYRYPGYAQPDTWVLSRILLEQAAQQPERPAIRFVDGPDWSYAQLRREALHCAHWLQQQGVQPGSRVALMTDEPEAFCRCWLGLALLGAVSVIINTGVRGEPLRHQLQLADTLWVLASSELMPVVADCGFKVALHDTASATHAAPLPQSHIHPGLHSDIASIMFTSGTSGPSKGVLMPHAHCVLFGVGTIDNLQLGADDCFYICLPLFHANGLLMQLLACLLSGACAVIRARFSASRWLADIRHYGATHTNLLGALSAFVVAQPETAQDSEHRLKVVGSAPLPHNSDRILRERFKVPDVIPMYGMTEVNIPLYGHMGEQAAGTCGRLYSRYFEAEIRDPDSDEPLPAGETGELMVRPRWVPSVLWPGMWACRQDRGSLA